MAPGGPATLRLGLAAGLGSGLRADPLGQLGTSGLAIPLFIGLRRDLALDQQLGKLPTLRLALEWHLASAAASHAGQIGSARVLGWTIRSRWNALAARRGRPGIRTESCSILNGRRIRR